MQGTNFKNSIVVKMLTNLTFLNFSFPEFLILRPAKVFQLDYLELILRIINLIQIWKSTAGNYLKKIRILGKIWLFLMSHS